VRLVKPVNIVFDNVTRARDMLLRARRDVRERPGDMSIGLVFVAVEAPGGADRNAEAAGLYCS